MVRIAFVLGLLLLPGLSARCQAPVSAEAQMNQIRWLLGSWARTNAAPGKSGYEIWENVSATAWKGLGISMKGTDTTFIEKLKIGVENGKLWYIADVPQNKGLVYFEITSVTNDSFVCENPRHDFPQTIAYKFDGKTIRARVSAGDRGIDYLFVRSN